MSAQNPWEMDENWEYNPENTASYGYNNAMSGFSPQETQTNQTQPAYQQQPGTGSLAGPGGNPFTQQQSSVGGSTTSGLGGGYGQTPNQQTPNNFVNEFRSQYADLLGIQGYTPPAFNSTYNQSGGPLTQSQWKDHVIEQVAKHFLQGSPELRNNMGRIGSKNGAYIRMLGLQPQKGQNAKLSDLYNQYKVTTKFW